MRHPAVAGQFYAGDDKSLRSQIEQCYLGPLGPGRLPKLSEGKRKVLGGVSPHAGYIYSGMVAAHLYARIAEDGFAKTFVVLGPNHTGAGSGLAVTVEDFETPLGTVKVDKELAKAIRKDLVDEDPEAHRHEHSIEVQLPFLQHISPDFRFVPLCMGFQDYEAATSVGRTIAGAIKGKDVVVIASTDMSHYVTKETAKRKDGLALDAIRAMDPRRLYEVVRDNDISMCGYGPVMATLTACAGGRATVLKYATSGDVYPMRDVVGYASVVIEKSD
ncbi:MAG: AmmeMemoRadiSam system protein B [Euryarchaeota archaeon RBG_16_62_10]|nr:MAG: AmmeMemoRadiSam system protein B [Euryarchaeota archaeon RBG_16_62_10]